MLARAGGRRDDLVRTLGPVLALVAANLVVAAAVAVGLGWMLVALAVVVPAGWLVARRPQRALLALAALTPFHGLLAILPVPGAAAYWKEAVALAALLASYVAPPSARPAVPRALPRWTVGVVALVAVGLASAVVVGGAQGLAGAKITFFYLVVLVTVWRCPFDGRERDRLVTILMAVGFVTAVIGLLQQVAGPARLHALGYGYNDTIRFAGSFMRSFSTFQQPFGFGFFLVVVLLMGIPAALDNSGRTRNHLFLLALPIYGLALLTTIVRGAWLGAAVGIVYLGGHRYRILLLLVPVTAVAILFLPAEAAAPALSGSSSVERATGWQQNLAAVPDHPLGLGIGSTGSAALAAQRLQGGPGAIYQTDNYYVKVLLELGLPGLWLLVLVLAALFAQARTASQRTRGATSAFAAGVAAVVLAAAAACLVATYFEIFPMDLLFWLLVGVVAGDAATATTGADRTLRAPVGQVIDV